MQRRLLKPHATLFAALLRALDPAAAVAVGVIAYVAYPPEGATPETYVLFLVTAIMAIMVVFPLFRLYEPQRGVSLADALRNLLLAWLVIAGIAAGALFATKTGSVFSRVWVSAWVIGSAATTTALRILLRVFLRAMRRRGLNQRHIVIAGAGTLGATVVDRLRAAPWAGFEVAGYFDDDPDKTGTLVTGRPCWATRRGFPRTCRTARSTRCGSRCRCGRNRAFARS